MGQPSAVTHDFWERLEYSQSQNANAIWEAVYRAAFEDYQTSVLCTDLLMQKQGIDRIVFLKSGKQIAVDEKTREKDYGDILLEHVSNTHTSAPGWVCKPMIADYLAYLIEPSQKCWLFPFEELRRAWQRNGTNWKRRAEQKERGYRNVIALNEGYNTLSVAIPVQVLTESIKNAMSIAYTLVGPPVEVGEGGE